ncbi:MAG: MerR family transcriptional regulator [Tissierellia bacterium]|nr:MerR family transcriptional regulator [Tissierellia bacterium]
MEYTVKQLAEIAGVTPRTLRYYDEIGILKPANTNSSGYRIYGPKEVDRLQQILLYRELGVNLNIIKEILDSPEFDEIEALKEHRNKLVEKREQLNQLIENVDKTLLSKERCIKMDDREKFEGFKRKLIKENEEMYGEEIRQKYGSKGVDMSNKKLMNMTEEEYEQLNKLQEEFIDTLQRAYETGDAKGELAQRAAELHSKWLCFFWKEYSKEAHIGVCQMYIDDERFRDYYDKFKPGTVEFLRDAVLAYTGLDQEQ